MSFSYNGPNICDVLVNNVSGRTGIGMSELCFSLGFQVSAFAKQDVVVRDFHVRVAVATDDGSAFEPLGIAVEEMSWYFDTKPGPTRHDMLFMMPIGEGQLFALEKMRAGRGLHFRLNVTALAYGTSGIWRQFEEVSCRVNLSTWARVLEGMQSTEYFVVGLELPRLEKNHALYQAIARLRKAKEFLISGRYDTVVSECRLAIENARITTGEEQAVAHSVQQFKTSKTSMGKLPREHLIAEAARHYAHLAHHDEGQPEIFSRDDANMLMSIAVAVVGGAIARLNSAV